MTDEPTGAGAEQIVPTCYRHAGRPSNSERSTRCTVPPLPITRSRVAPACCARSRRS